MTGRIKYPNDNYKYVTEITIKVSPARFNPDQFIEKMILKNDFVSYVKTFKNDNIHPKKWSYKSNADDFSILFNAIVNNVDYIFNREMLCFPKDKDIFKITRRYDDNSIETIKFTGDLDINDLNSLGMFILELVPKTEIRPNFLSCIKEELDDYLF